MPLPGMVAISLMVRVGPFLNSVWQKDPSLLTQQSLHWEGRYQLLTDLLACACGLKITRCALLTDGP